MTNSMPSDRPINVTHVVFDFNGGGMETLVAEMGKRFHGTSVHVSLITMGGRAGRLGEATRDYFTQFHVMRPRRGIGFLYPIDVARVIAQTRAEVVHTHTGSWHKGARGGRLAGVRRVLYTEHGREHYDPLRNRVGDRIVSRKTDVVVAVSARLQYYLRDRIGIAASKLCTIENGVDTGAFAPGAASAALRASLQIPEGALVIGSIGRLEPVKAYDRVLEAAARLRGHLAQPLVVVIGGDGSQRAPLQAKASALGIADMVRLPGWSSQPLDLYRLFDVFVVSSLSEGQSVSLMEAMACGVPCVVTDVGGNAEMLGSALTSQVVRGDAIVDKLANAIRATLVSPQTRDAVASEVRRRAERHYSLAQMTASYERLYRANDIPPDLVR